MSQIATSAGIHVHGGPLTKKELKDEPHERHAVDRCRTAGRCLADGQQSQDFRAQREVAPHGSAAGRWLEDFSPGALKAIAVLEILGALGPILPAALNIAPVPTPLAALGVVSLFVGAVIMRLRSCASIVARGSQS
jgi:hypothetical protein